MNRSILIVICDFLLVSLLAFSTVDINKVTDEGAQRQLKIEIATNQVDSGPDLAAVMRLALSEERKQRDLLMGELSQVRATAAQRQTELEAKEQESRRLQEQGSTLQQQFAIAQASLQSLTQQLAGASSETQRSKEQLAQTETEVRKQADQTAALQRQLDELAKSNQVVLAERERLANQLRLSETEKRAATEQAARMQEEVKVEREEKARLTQQAEKLAEGVKTLASRSGELAQEIRENRPLAPNTIFNEFVANRVNARFSASRPGLFGGANKQKETETVLASDRTNTFALCHVQDTPLVLWNPGTDWEALEGVLRHSGATVPVHSLSFYQQDPRVILLPIAPEEARALGCKVYQISADPFKFQDAVLVGAREGYYGECKFEIDLTTPGYVRLDRSFIRGLFGKFNPSRGDLVFSRTGELLGIMANDSYCMMIRNFDAAASFQLGQDLRPQHTGAVLSQLYTMVSGLPFKLQ